jgi:hypothetical protein
MGNLPALLPNATHCKRFFVNVKETSVLKQQMLTLKKFSIWQDFSCKQNYQRISGQMSFTIEDKALMIYQ